MKKKIIYSVIFLTSIYAMLPLANSQQEEQIELISLDLKGMDIRDVLKILSQKSGLNIVADKDVKGTVSIYIKDVDVMTALDIIATTNGLAYEEDGTLVRVMPDRSYEKLHGAAFRDRGKIEIVKLNYADASDVSKTIAKMKTKLGNVIPDERSNTIVLIDTPDAIENMKDAISEIDIPFTTEVFSLDYAKAEPIKAKLEQMVSKNGGDIKFDERTNKIVVRDTSKKIDDIRKVIEAFDEKTREVAIDANIIQVTLSDKYSYGIDWVDIARLGGIRFTGDTNLSTGITGVTPSTLTIATTAGNYSTVISLLKTFGETNVLSRPRITVADKEEAKILVGSKEVYVSSEVTTTSGGTYHTTDHVEFVDVGVTMSVTPEINREGFIKLKIKPEVSSTDATKTVQLKNPDGSTRTIVPFVTTSEAETTVLVKDNTTLIIAGLMKDTMVDHKEKVPILGDIPLLGKLFRTTGQTKEKTELVIFLTPHIIEGDRTTEEASFYIDEWKAKETASKIEKPKEPEFKLERRQLRSGKDDEARKAKRRDRPIPRIRRNPYEEYYLTIRELIYNVAQKQDLSGLRGEVELQFMLDKDGFVTRGPIVLNEPDLRLVRAAIDCIKSVSPFPPFSEGLDKDEAEFYIVVRYE